MEEEAKSIFSGDAMLIKMSNHLGKEVIDIVKDELGKKANLISEL